MRASYSTLSLSVLAALLAAACNGGSNTADAGDGGNNAADVPYDGLTCSQVAQICNQPVGYYEICCSSCTDGATCGYSNPGLDGGNGNSVSMCTNTCTTLADCPHGPNGELGLCVRGICYQSCESDGSTCATGEECVALYDHRFCAAVACQ